MSDKKGMTLAALWAAGIIRPLDHLPRTKRIGSVTPKKGAKHGTR